MTDTERREAARQFYHKWLGKGKEDEDDRSYWLDILQRILGADDATDRCEFQKKVIVDGNTKKIDAYIPETKVIIEQKSLGINLDKKIHQSGGIELTPYEQAKRYNDNLPSSEKARWIVTSNFSDIWIYDMDTRIPEDNITKLSIAELQDKYSMLGFLLSKEVKKITEEMEISLKAGELVGKIYDRFFEQYNDPTSKESQNSLNILCVRLVFCLYAEDAGLFGEKDAFSRYISQYEPKDIRRALLDLFRVLDTPLEQRGEMYLDDELAAFPYVNGGLFAKENIEIPKITDEIKQAITESSHFDWSKISPTIFGAVFESTLNPETRRSGGMHYTSIENIHKVIDPLFLDDLRKEFEEARAVQVKRTKENKLRVLQEKMAGLKFLDPACGSGNFLTETYISLRRIENEILGELFGGQITLGYTGISPIKIHISQFYGIEINDFAVTVAKTALWIAESQMMKETEDILLMDLTFLPLKTNANIVEGNALRLDWNTVVDKQDLSYIMGNPPFVGARLMSGDQKKDIDLIFHGWKNAGNLDYVASWFKKAADLMKGTSIRAALVSTNSVCQGETVANLWKPLFESGVHIDFAHRTFRWDSEAKSKAHVHCVIVGFSIAPNGKKKQIFSNEKIEYANNINAYLVDADNIFVESRNKPICDIPNIGIGNKPIDGGNYLFTDEEKVAFVKKEPDSEKWFMPWYGSQEFINRNPRWCLWLGNCPPNELRKMPECMKRVEAVQQFRLSSTSAGTVKLADKPTRFHVENMPAGTYVVIPEVSSERRRYVPIGFMTPDILCSNLVKIVPDATLFHFGILTSNIHMAWMRAVCGRLKSDYRYSKDVVYNNFPWPKLTDEQKSKIEKTAQTILDARALYPDSSLADLYDPLTMPPELRRAHQENDKAVMQAYGFDVKNTSEAECVAKLMQMYKTLTEQ